MNPEQKIVEVLIQHMQGSKIKDTAKAILAALCDGVEPVKYRYVWALEGNRPDIYRDDAETNVLGYSPPQPLYAIPPDTQAQINALKEAAGLYKTAKEFATEAAEQYKAELAKRDARIEELEDALHDQHQKLQAAVLRVAELEKDAARYRYLRNSDTDIVVVVPETDDASCPVGQDLDAAIDAAIAQEQAK